MHHLQGVLSFYLAKVTKIITVTNLIKAIDKMFNILINTKNKIIKSVV
jgi:hypothetical protein